MSDLATALSLAPAPALENRSVAGSIPALGTTLLLP